MAQKLTITVQRAIRDPLLPSAVEVKKWLAVAYAHALKAGPINGMPKKRDSDTNEATLTIRWVGALESQTLNHAYRQKNKPTNVLSFPYSSSPLSGDLVLCVSVIHEEAQQFNKSFTARCAHLIVHGLLHLMGYTHEKPTARKQMEALEKDILSSLGFNDPYVF